MKTDKPLVKLITKKKREKAEIIIIKNETSIPPTDATNIQKTVRRYYEQFL
jgi:hypothetical protein